LTVSPGCLVPPSKVLWQPCAGVVVVVVEGLVVLVVEELVELDVDDVEVEDDVAELDVEVGAEVVVWAPARLKGDAMKLVRITKAATTRPGRQSRVDLFIPSPLFTPAEATVTNGAKSSNRAVRRGGG
jgi:hypothetical protein